MKSLFLAVTIFLVKQVLGATPLNIDTSAINLPPEHLPYYFTAFPEAASKCRNDPACPYKDKRYWGYRNNLGRYSSPQCYGDILGYPENQQQRNERVEKFFTEADFGFIKQQREEIKELCLQKFSYSSHLECSNHFRYCNGRNIMFNFTKLSTMLEPFRYNTDLLNGGAVGGHCQLKRDEIEANADHISALQSWGPELRYFTQLEKNPAELCDIVIDKRTFIMKIDATFNMYHHFCDFFNLYASQHLYDRSDAFSTDMHILIWETFDYRSPFQDTWQAFTQHSLWDLKKFRGKTVCFKDVIFPLLPRMIFGLYYNTPLTKQCKNSGLFHAFSKHILHRLQVPVHPILHKKIRVTFLCRDTTYRRILNEDQLVEAMNDEDTYEVRRVVFNKDIPFQKQLEISANSDVLVGIHGAGLTHLLFLPDWATVFEIYNCEDPNCYSDLARLRGVNYVTWTNTSLISSERDNERDDVHAKFQNYSFDVEEFKQLLRTAADLVRNHPQFIRETNIGQEHDEL